jgi:hypothetical protein
MHIEYCIHRYGEWCMLMLGESILSLLIVDIVNSLQYYGSFFAGMITIILLELLHFRSQPHDPDEHAMRRDRRAGLTFNMLFQAYSVSLVILGATYKMFLFEAVYENHPSSGANNYSNSTTSAYNHRSLSFGRALLSGGEPSAALSIPTNVRQQMIANLFSASMAIVLFCLDAMILTHKGVRANTHRIECWSANHQWWWRVLEYLLVASRVGLIGFIASVGQYVTRPKVLALVGMGGIQAQLVLRGVGTILFPTGDELLECEARGAAAAQVEMGVTTMPLQITSLLIGTAAMDAA